jgi:hypothetical protein
VVVVAAGSEILARWRPLLWLTAPGRVWPVCLPSLSPTFPTTAQDEQARAAGGSVSAIFSRVAHTERTRGGLPDHSLL